MAQNYVIIHECDIKESIYDAPQLWGDNSWLWRHIHSMMGHNYEAIISGCDVTMNIMVHLHYEVIFYIVKSQWTLECKPLQYHNSP